MRPTEADLASAIDRDGFAIIPSLLRGGQVDALCASIKTKLGRSHALRNVLREVPQITDLVRAPTIRSLLTSLGQPGAMAVRGIFFDKTPQANWKVAWHQDLSIAVRERVDLPGFGPWSRKQDVVHVEPPIDVLQRMFTVRIHLDETGEDNGPVRVLPTTHRHGRLSPDDIARYRADVEPVVCLVPRGGAMLMKPLLLHASSQSTRPMHRRVLHLEFADFDLPDALTWADRVGESC